MYVAILGQYFEGDYGAAPNAFAKFTIDRSPSSTYSRTRKLNVRCEIKEIEMFRIFFTDGSVATGQIEPNYDAIMPYKCNTSDEAVRRALSFVRMGYIVWKIDGPNGFCVNRQRLEAAIAAADKKTGTGN